MSHSIHFSRTLLFAGCFLTIAAVVAYSGSAFAETLRGTWVGSGHINPGNGQRERVRCRVTYSPRSARIIGVVATCASPSATLRQTGELVKVSESRYVGDFYNSQFDLSGRVRVLLSGGRQTVTLSSSRGGGSLVLRRR